MAASKEEDEKGDEKAPKKGKDHFVNLVLSFGPSLLALGLWRRGSPAEMLGVVFCWACYMLQVRHFLRRTSVRRMLVASLGSCDVRAE